MPTVTRAVPCGPAALAAPQPDEGTTRDVLPPTGTRRDVTDGEAVSGPVTLKAYAAPPGVTPAFVGPEADGATEAYQALARTGAER